MVLSYCLLLQIQLTRAMKALVSSVGEANCAIFGSIWYKGVLQSISVQGKGVVYSKRSHPVLYFKVHVKMIHFSQDDGSTELFIP